MVNRLFSWVAPVLLLSGAAVSSGPPGAVNVVVPAPVSVRSTGSTFTLDKAATIGADPAARPVADYLAGVLRRSTGYRLPITGVRGATIALRLEGHGNPEAYRLDVDRHRVTIEAARPNGLFYGVQTLLQ